jgi:hypothetical protein
MKGYHDFAAPCSLARCLRRHRDNRKPRSEIEIGLPNYIHFLSEYDGFQCRLHTYPWSPLALRFTGSRAHMNERRPALWRCSAVPELRDRMIKCVCDSVRIDHFGREQLFVKLLGHERTVPVAHHPVLAQIPPRPRQIRMTLTTSSQ